MHGCEVENELKIFNGKIFNKKLSRKTKHENFEGTTRRKKNETKIQQRNYTKMV